MLINLQIYNWFYSKKSSGTFVFWNIELNASAKRTVSIDGLGAAGNTPKEMVACVLAVEECVVVSGAIIVLLLIFDIEPCNDSSGRIGTKIT